MAAIPAQAAGLGLAVLITMVAARTPTGYMGCWREGATGRALTDKSYTDTGLTTAACLSFCAGHRYSGTEYGTECYCGTKIMNSAYQVPDSACTTPCGGADSETCGGNELVSVYKASFSDQTPQLDYVYVGCWGEPDNDRALERVTQMSLLTRNKCLTTCAYGDYHFAGLQYGNECWCGNDLRNSPSYNATCDTPCAGNSSETCGGNLALDLFYGSSKPDS